MKQGIFSSIAEVVDFMLMLEFSAQVRFILADHGYWRSPSEIQEYVTRVDCSDIASNPYFMKVIVNEALILEKYARELPKSA